jgi:hypothetical protein
MRSAKLGDTWRFEKGISWDSSQREDTNLIPKNKNFGLTKISLVFFTNSVVVLTTCVFSVFVF